MKRNKNLKKSMAALLALVMLISVMLMPVGAQQQAGAEQAAAETLHALGLFRGVGTTAGGEPIFALEDTATRLQGLIMLTRFLGLYDEAIGSDYPNPFEDVQGAYDAAIVSFAFGRGLTTGVSAVRFAPNDGLTADQYLTFVLRSLGYESGTDFEWDTAWTLTDSLGITDGGFNAHNNTLYRGGMAVVSLRAMFTPGSEGVSLFETLVKGGVISAEAIDALAGALGSLAGLGVIGTGHLEALNEAAELLLGGGYITAPLSSRLGSAIEDAEAAILAPPTNGADPGNAHPPVEVRGNVMFITGWARNALVRTSETQSIYSHAIAFDMNGDQILGPDGAPGVPIAGLTGDNLVNNNDTLFAALAARSPAVILPGFATFELDRYGRFHVIASHAEHIDAAFGFSRNVIATLNSLAADGSTLIVELRPTLAIPFTTVTSMARHLPVTAVPIPSGAPFNGPPTGALPAGVTVSTVDDLFRILNPASEHFREGVIVSVAYDTARGPLGNAVRGRVFVHSWGTPG